MGKLSGINLLTIVIVSLSFSCSGYIAEKYKIVHGTRCIYHGSRMQMLIEDMDSIEDLVIETSQSFDLRKISVDEARERYFWLDSNKDIIFAYCNPTVTSFTI